MSPTVFSHAGARFLTEHADQPSYYWPGLAAELLELDVLLRSLPERSAHDEARLKVGRELGDILYFLLVPLHKDGREWFPDTSHDLGRHWRLHTAGPYRHENLTDCASVIVSNLAKMVREPETCTLRMTAMANAVHTLVAGGTLHLIAGRYGLTLSDCADLCLVKLTSRLAHGTIHGDGDHRG